MRFLAGGVLAATVVMLGPAWWLGPPWLGALWDQRRLVFEAWVGWALLITWLLRALWAVVFLRASGGRLKASSAS
jgi:hypothetical protein